MQINVNFDFLSTHFDTAQRISSMERTRYPVWIRQFVINRSIDIISYHSANAEKTGFCHILGNGVNCTETPINEALILRSFYFPFQLLIVRFSPIVVNPLMNSVAVASRSPSAACSAELHSPST